MNGSIDVQSEPGIGSTFSVRLPIKSSSVDADPSTNQNDKGIESQSVNHRTPYASKTALVVDDSKINRKLLRSYLDILGIKSISTNNLKRAHQLFFQRMPDIVFLDLHLGSKSSLGLARSIRNSPIGKAIPIFFVTADVHFHAVDWPGNGEQPLVLYKPVSLQDLQNSVHSIFKNSNHSSPPMEGVQDADFSVLRRKLCKLLMSQLPGEISMLQEAIVRQDYRSIALIAHRIRGAAANIEWAELAAISSRLENEANLAGDAIHQASWDRITLAVSQIQSIAAPLMVND